MDFKIITVSALGIDLLIRRDVTSEETACVILTFFGVLENDGEYQVEEVVNFESPQTAQQYVRDFSEESAAEFVNLHLRQQPTN